MFSVSEPRRDAARVDKRGIIAYLLINFALTWGLDFVLLARGARFANLTGGLILALAASPGVAEQPVYLIYTEKIYNFG